MPGASASRLLRRRDLTVDQLSLVFPEVGFDGLLARERGWGPFGIAFDELVMDQVLAHQADFELRIQHPPDLTAC
jgi:hypothetical protein